jgi:hypothetical protein
MSEVETPEICCEITADLEVALRDGFPTSHKDGMVSIDEDVRNDFGTRMSGFDSEDQLIR